MAWAQSSSSSSFFPSYAGEPNPQNEPLLKPQDLNEDPAAWVESIREDLPYFGDYFESQEAIDDVGKRRSDYSQVLTVVQSAIEGSLAETYQQPPASILLQCIQHLKLWKKMYHGMRAHPFSNYKPTEAKLENLNKLIKHVENLLIEELFPHLQGAPWKNIAAALRKDVSGIDCPPYLIELYENETIYKKHFILSCCALIFKTDDNEPLFRDELALVNVFEQMHEYSGPHGQLKEMAFELLKEEEISEIAFVKVANLLLQGDSVSFEEIYRVLLKEAFICFARENKEDTKFARKRAAKLDAFPKDLDLEAKKQLVLQLCHDAFWLEAKLDFPFVDIVLQHLEALYSEYSSDELPTEYHYLRNLRTLREAASKAEEVVNDDLIFDDAKASPNFVSVYQNLVELDAIVRDFSEEDKEEAYEKANRLMEKVLPGDQKEESAIQVDIEESSGLFDTLSSKVVRDASTFKLLGFGTGAVSTIIGAGLVMAGVIGIAASIASAFVTLGTSTPLASLGVLANLGLITAGIAMFKVGEILLNAGDKQYQEALEIQTRLNKVSKGLGEAVCGNESIPKGWPRASGNRFSRWSQPPPVTPGNLPVASRITRTYGFSSSGSGGG